MPFGDNTRTYVSRIDRDDFGPHVRKIPGRLIHPPVADPPAWWSEYLIEEWKRRYNVLQKPRICRTAWQQAEDQWRTLVWRWSANDPHCVAEPKHGIWEQDDAR